MPPSRCNNSRRRRRWANRALVCSTTLLLVSPLTAFVGPPSRKRGSASIRRHAAQVEEETVLSDAQQESPLHHDHYAFEPVASVEIVGVDDLHQEMNVHRRNGGSSNGFPLHAVAYEFPDANGEPLPNKNGYSGHSQTTRVVNGVNMPPYYKQQVNGKESPAVRNGAYAEPQARPRNGSVQPPLVNGALQSDRNGNTQPSDDNVVGEIGVESDINDYEYDNDDEKSQQPTVRKLWQRRHARSIEEGVRCEKTREKTTQLSRILSKAPLGPRPKRAFFARTISGLINALAEEAEGLEVEVKAQEETPLWRKKVDAIEINFSRLGFKPLRMGGLDEAIRSLELEISESRVDELARDLELAAVSSADEAFDRIDEDNSGALDQDEIARALNMAASSDSDKQLFEHLASQLVELYDFNGDGVVDREEYQNLVTDMATLRRAEKAKLKKQDEDEQTSGIRGAIGKVSRWIRRDNKHSNEEEGELDVVEIYDDEDGMVEDRFVDVSEDTTAPLDVAARKAEKFESSEEVVNISDDSVVSSVAKSGGSIVLEDMKLDLRQLVFGVLPVIKRVSSPVDFIVSMTLPLYLKSHQFTFPLLGRRLPQEGR